MAKYKCCSINFLGKKALDAHKRIAHNQVTPIFRYALLIFFHSEPVFRGVLFICIAQVEYSQFFLFLYFQSIHLLDV